ncbi:hypothetical protein BJ6T_08920 [Bradyrhizobium japonicum USDA 6]|nr:hypothetical protein CF64_38550 [Bradyrhizobium japonicum]BAL06185.1 hypothetical protein BJ6T_08920 [Bradyrhizobium japonicum USDA 6]
MNQGDGKIVCDGLPDHLDYLQVGSQSLLKGEFAQHTPLDVVSENVIPFKINSGSEAYSGKLIVPDYFGERWMYIFRKREWSEEWEDRISQPCGILMFVRASSDQIVSPLDWIQCERMWGVPIVDGTQQELEAPTQVVMTDWLQFFAEAFAGRRGGGERPKVALIIAAWDRVPKDRQAEGPAAYLSQEFPLLSQFVESNDDQFDFAAFGVTVAGGDFDHEPEFKKQSLDQDNPLSGGYVMHELSGAPTIAKDMTLPISWVMGFEAERRS